MVQKRGQFRIVQVLLIALIASCSLCGCTTSRQSSASSSDTAPNGTVGVKDNSRISQATLHKASSTMTAKKTLASTQRHTAICSNLVLSGNSEGAPSGGIFASSSTTTQGGTFLDAFRRLTERLKENTPTARISLAAISILLAAPFVLAFAKLRQTKIIVESQLYHQA